MLTQLSALILENWRHLLHTASRQIYPEASARAGSRAVAKKIAAEATAAVAEAMKAAAEEAAEKVRRHGFEAG